MAEKQLITTSSAKIANRCRREYYHSIECGMQAVGDITALNWGTVWHTAMELLWSGNEEWDAQLAMSHIRACDEWPKLTPEDQTNIEVLLYGYVTYWMATQSQYTPQFVERKYQLPLINPETGKPSRLFERAGKLDAGIVLDGKFFIVEHKSSGADISPGSKYWERLKIDSQCSNYYDGVRSFGLDPHGIIYDVVRKPSIRRLLATPVESRKYTKAGALYANQREFDETLDEYRERLIADVAERPEFYFVRSEVVRLESEEIEAAYDVYDTAQAIHQNQLRGRWPRNTDACERWGKMCQYWEVCTGSASIDDESKFKHVGAHTELL